VVAKVGPDGRRHCGFLFTPEGRRGQVPCMRYADHLPTWAHSAHADPPVDGWALVAPDGLMHATDGDCTTAAAVIEGRYALGYLALAERTRCGLSTLEMRPPALADLGSRTYCQRCLPYG